MNRQTVVETPSYIALRWHALHRSSIFLITAFPKNKKANLTKAERNSLKKRADGIFDSYGHKPSGDGS